MYRQFNNRQANNVLFNPVMPQQHYPQYVYQQPQAQVRYQPQVQYIQYPQQVQYIKKPAQYLQYQRPVYQQTPYQQVQQRQFQRPVRYQYIQQAQQAAYVNQYQARIPMKYAQKLNQVQNPRNGNTYSLDTFEPIITQNTQYTTNSQGQKERYDEYLTRKAFQDNNLMPKINNIPAQTYNNQYGSVIYY